MKCSLGEPQKEKWVWWPSCTVPGPVTLSYDSNAIHHSVYLIIGQGTSCSGFHLRSTMLCSQANYSHSHGAATQYILWLPARDTGGLWPHLRIIPATWPMPGMVYDLGMWQGLWWSLFRLCHTDSCGEKGLGLCPETIRIPIINSYLSTTLTHSQTTIDRLL